MAKIVLFVEIIKKETSKNDNNDKNVWNIFYTACVYFKKNFENAFLPTYLHKVYYIVGYKKVTLCR